MQGYKQKTKNYQILAALFHIQVLQFIFENTAYV